jgi:hypothetical protein
MSPQQEKRNLDRYDRQNAWPEEPIHYTQHLALNSKVGRRRARQQMQKPEALTNPMPRSLRHRDESNLRTIPGGVAFLCSSPLCEHGSP